ncbi:hypothetical protein XENORESO_018616 [Xenotaenia resolanae]|uniref:Ig-like domain-containing protein n=1 Tax=Xenotaenia resolanae TaxID=208358 RepID=A0ABV0WPE4_9TELE
MSVTGTAGKPITIKCSHSYATTNVKYFCKGACNYEEVLIKSNDVNRDQNGKYCIKDDGNTFSVTISNLEMSDEGIYWCGIERAGVDTYNKVKLRVVGIPGGSLKTLHPKKLMYVGTGVGVAVLALAIVLLLFFKLRKRNVSTSQGKDDDVKYATPSSTQKITPQANGTSSVNEEQEPNCRITMEPTEVLYSNIASEPKVQSDELFYATIGASKHPTCSPVPTQPELTTYSSVQPKYAASIR